MCTNVQVIPQLSVGIAELLQPSDPGGFVPHAGGVLGVYNLLSVLRPKLILYQLFFFPSLLLRMSNGN